MFNFRIGECVELLDDTQASIFVRWQCYKEATSISVF